MGILGCLITVGIVILVILLMMTLDAGSWWKDLKGLSNKQKIFGLILLIIIWLIVGLLVGNINF
ncbi:hypothetical protein [Tepidibacillus sp. HK-1]|uniref:hypothetical protein n=1 Tax=Tepidibacillus sp. HK-1 TaxID=1883407 RepID=UPI00085357A4|nr:hypothetical protein [Tepidibacillus sp. HK-1]GBF11205.1 hypothetical protein HK1_01229 [Tepidibacillus sp. HK-1]